MRFNRLSTAIAVIFSLAVVPLAHGDDGTTFEIAEIVLNIVIKPSAATKETLDSIATYTASTSHEQTLARALIHIDKKLHPMDKPKVLKVMISPGASVNERDLAKALLRFNDRANDYTKMTLSQIVQLSRISVNRP